MKILTILGTRPEIIRLSRVIPRLDEALGRENHILVNTGQNSDPRLSVFFFKELGLRAPDHTFCAAGTLGQQLAVIMREIEVILLRERPDRLLVLGDTNSSLAAIVAARMGVPVYHMEAGNRSYSPTSPEEVNRRLIDHASAVLLPYTERSRANLLAEGIHSSRIMVTGNPIKEVLNHHAKEIAVSDVHARLGLEGGKYFLVTLHRAENVDDAGRLSDFLYALNLLREHYEIPVVVSLHPHTKSRVVDSYWADSKLHICASFGFFDFLALERSARCVLSDSGTVQEECAILGVPLVCLRDHTERPECLEAGASVLSGADPSAILSAVTLVTSQRAQWTPPAEYLRTNVSETVVRILLGHREGGQL